MLTVHPRQLIAGTNHSVIPLLIVAAGLAGCSSKEPVSSRPVLEAPPRIGYVNYAAIEAIDPKTPILNSVNASLDIGSRYLAKSTVPVKGLNVDQYLNQVASHSEVSVRQGLEAQQNSRLEIVSQSILDSLNRRLLAAEQLKIDSLRAEQVVAGQAKLADAAAALQNQAVQQSGQFKIDEYRIASLKMQIAAMKLNEQPPRSAPIGYWTKLQTARETELNDLLTEYYAQLKTIFDRRDELIAQEEMAINSGIDASTEESKKDAEAQRLEMLSSARVRFDKEQAQLDDDDRRVFSEAQLLVSSPRVKTLPDTTGGDLKPISMPSGIDGTAYLLGYRSRLQSEIRLESMHSIDVTARKLNIKIVEKRSGVPDLTPLFVEAVRDLNWKVS